LFSFLCFSAFAPVGAFYPGLLISGALKPQASFWFPARFLTWQLLPPVPVFRLLRTPAVPPLPQVQPVFALQGQPVLLLRL
jgi:hypothetical protein